MWSVNSGGSGCSAQSTVVERRTSPDGRAWGDPISTNLVQPGQVIWHLDVQWVPSRQEYWALYNTYPVGGTCVSRALFLGRSSDGVHWNVPSRPLLVAGRVPAFEDVVYRSTFRVSDNGQWLELLVSGADYNEGGYIWRIGRMVVSPDEALDGQMDSEADNVDWRLPAPVQMPPPEPFDQP